MLESKRQMMEQISVYLHHDAITGTDRQFVADDYTHRVNRATIFSNRLYKQILEKKLLKETGFELKANLTTCIGS